MKLNYKIIGAFFALGIVLGLSACGSKNKSDDPNKWSEKQTCELVVSIRDDIRKIQVDVAEGKMDIGKGIVEVAMIQTRIGLVQQGAPEGDLKVAIDRWALSRQRIIDNPTAEGTLGAQLTDENEEAFTALDKKCA